MINVLHSIDTGGPGGAETVFINLVTGLDPKRFKSIAVIPRKGWVCEQLLSKGVKPHIVDSKGEFSIKYLWQLIKILKSQKINIIQSHLFGSNVYCSLAGLICRVPVVSGFHGFVDAGEKELLLDLKFKLINGGSKKIVFVSNQLKDHFLERTCLNKKKSITIYNGIDTDAFKPRKADNLRRELELSEEHILIGCIGNIRPAKGYDILIKAAALIVKEYPDCRFIIAGQGSGPLYEDHLKLVHRLKLEKFIKFLGFRKDSANILNNLDIFVLPSTTEGFSISTIEAMACGIPVVVTKSGGPEEIVKDGENGIMVDAGAVTGLAKGLIEAILNKNKAMIENARNDVEEKFKKDVMITNYNELYQKYS